VSGYRRQSRGGRGSTGATTKEDDFIEHMFIASTHDYMMLFTNRGRCYWLKVFEIPEGGRAARGKSIANLISKEPEETLASYVSVRDFEESLNVMMVTEQGMIKKTALREFSNPRRTGIAAVTLGKGDRLIDVRLIDGSQDIVIGTHEGVAIRFHEQEVRAMGRGASGVRAIRLERKDRVIGAVALRRTGTTILVVTEKGFGKRSETEEYRVSHRGGKGIITVKTSEKTGKMVAIREVVESDDVVVVTSGGIVIRQHASEIRVAGRNTQGVRLIKLGAGDSVSDVAAVAAEEPEISEGGDSGRQAGENSREKGENSLPEKKTLNRMEAADATTKSAPVQRKEPPKDTTSKTPVKQLKRPGAGARKDSSKAPRSSGGRKPKGRK